ncbi:MAG: GAF domain-containing sensor histidine kinase [Flavobacteriaceae bacterium]|nr:GAF domain-containing sensor histidine kinase [Flavobacteriaceae bacterium]
MTPTIPVSEAKRLEALKKYKILHTEKESEYEQITDLATNLTGMPISLISFVAEDEVWVKSARGIEISSIPRELAICGHELESSDSTIIIEDLQSSPLSEKISLNGSTDSIRFYASVSLIDRNGFKLGSLCVIDRKPNTLTKEQVTGLQILARQVINLVELHEANHILKDIKVDLEKKNNELKDFAGIVSHDMKMPLANIIVTTDILKTKYAAQLDETASQYLHSLKQSSFRLSDYISGLLTHYESDYLSKEDHEVFDIHHLLEEIVEMFQITTKCDIDFPEENVELNCSRAALEQILMNLIGNSLKYNDKEYTIISIECKRRSNIVHFKITDNGIGIPENNIDEIFDLFTTVENSDQEENQGNGIGLSTVKKLVNNLGGNITAKSTLGEGTTFEFHIKG